MCTRAKLYNLIKILKNPYLGRAPSNHQSISVMILYEPFSYNVILNVPLILK